MVQVDASFAHDWSDRDSATGRSFTPRMPRAAGVSAGLAATMPAGACDCHMHVYARGYPLRPGWTAAVPDAPLAAYRRVQRALGLARTIVVQANAYGFDNTCVENALHELGASARGVATVRPDVADAELARLHAAGFRGARGHLLPGAQLTWRDVATIAARIAPLGWHVQLQFDGRELPERLALIASLPTDVVLDHNGKFLEPVAASHPSFAALMRLLERGRTWVKLSAPYETSRAGPPRYDDVSALATALARTHPERCLWGTNWPHPGTAAPPSESALLALFGEWAPDAATRARILVDNPARLYEF
jgi:D-galactarolactone isomerase